jgi:N-acetylneuraminic acid mutarotase
MKKLNLLLFILFPIIFSNCTIENNNISVDGCTKPVLLHIIKIMPDSAYIGDVVSIIGTGFGSAQGESRISFNNTEAIEFTSWSETEIKVKVPIGAASGKVWVMVNGNNSNEVDFKVINLSNNGLKRNDFPGGPRAGAVGFSVGNKGYICGGWDFYGKYYYKDLWEYNPLNDSWIKKPDYPGKGTDYMVCFVINDKAYIGTGINNNDFWEYNPITSQWSKIANFPGSANWEMCSFTIGKKGYLCGGKIPYGSNVKELWEYDSDNNIWSRKADFPGIGPSGAMGFSLNNKGYVGCGDRHSIDLWEYDPIQNKWTRKNDFDKLSRSFPVGISINNLGYMVTGCSGKSYPFNDMNDVWQYNPLTDSWVQLPDLGCPGRRCAVGFSINNIIYIATGYDGKNPLNDVWEFAP